MFYNNQIIAGIDEAGRGPLFGPVVACAVVFNDRIDISEIKDSKKISPLKREKLYNQLNKENIDYGIGLVHEQEIDKINILNATKKAMLIAVKNLKKTPSKLLIDGNQTIESSIEQEAIVKGDQKIPEISAASIIAKVARDKVIENYSKVYPMFELSKHKGYGTKLHIELLYEFGPSSVHRHTFAPVKQIRYGSFKIYESLSIVRYTLSIIKRGFNIDYFNIAKDIPFMLYEHMFEKIYVVSVYSKDLSEINSIILDIKKKDSVKKARLDVIYSDDKSTTPRVQYSCEIC
tara:strand:+ start:784 stop:1653 length:870 start_codon:yes stop_codon:yes gene_type:complete